MSTQNNVKHLATQTSAKVYALTPVMGFDSLQVGRITEVVFRDDAKNYCVCVGTIDSNNDFTMINLRNSSEQNNSEPDFGNGLELVSTIGEVTLNRKLYGMGGVTIAGQSNAPAVATGQDPLKDFTNPNIWQYKFRFDPASSLGTNYEPDEVLLAQESLYHLYQAPADTVSAAPYFAKWLLGQGFNQICLLPAGQGSSAFETSDAPAYSNRWKILDPNYIRMRDQINSFLSLDPNNYMVAILWMHGESDAMMGMTQAVYTAHLKLLHTTLIAEVLAATGYDLTGVPFLASGMKQAFVDDAVNVGTVQEALMDIGNYIPFSAFADMSSYTDNPGDIYHHGPIGQRGLGQVQWQLAYNLALANISHPSLLTLSATPASVTVAPIAATITTKDILTLEATSPSVAVIAGSGTITVNEVLTLNATPASATVSIPSAQLVTTDQPAIRLIKGQAIDDGSGNFVSWPNMGSGSYTIDQVTTTRRPTVVGGAVVIDGIEPNSQYFRISPSPLNGDENTIIIDMLTPTTAVAGAVAYSDGANFMSPENTNATAALAVTMGGNLTADITLRDSARHFFAITQTVAGIETVMVIDGVVKDSITVNVINDATSGDLLFGVYSDATSANFPNAMTIYGIIIEDNKALTLAEIIALQNNMVV